MQDSKDSNTVVSSSSSTQPAKAQQIALRDPQRGTVEAKETIRDRLRKGVSNGIGDGPLLLGTILNPTETAFHTAKVPEHEINKLIEDITQIKALLLCRYLLSSATLLPIALRAESIEAFLANDEVTSTDLRDVAIHIEGPSLQALRDACADFARDNELEVAQDSEAQADKATMNDYVRRPLKYLAFDWTHNFMFRGMLSSDTRSRLDQAAKDLGATINPFQTTANETPKGSSPYAFYNDADAAEVCAICVNML